MRLRLWPYFLRQALANIISNRIVHVIGLGTMVVSLLIFCTFLLVLVNLHAWVGEWGRSLTMSVYLQDGISEAGRDNIKSVVRSLPGAQIRRFISKERALTEFRRALGSQSGLLDGLSHNPLPASFEVVFDEVEGKKVDARGIKQNLEKVEGIEEVQYSEEWVDRFKGLMKMIRLVGFIIGGLLCMGILFIVMNTIKLTIYSRKEEIEILKLVGATDWFVKIPFMLEGMIQGIISGALALVIIFLGYLIISTERMHFLDLAVFDFVFIPNEYALSIFLLSVALGLVGSFIAVGRFFKV
jgi:cell division transport system permease protein